MSENVCQQIKRKIVCVYEKREREKVSQLPKSLRIECVCVCEERERKFV